MEAQPAPTRRQPRPSPTAHASRAARRRTLAAGLRSVSPPSRDLLAARACRGGGPARAPRTRAPRGTHAHAWRPACWLMASPLPTRPRGGKQGRAPTSGSARKASSRRRGSPHPGTCRCTSASSRPFRRRRRAPSRQSSRTRAPGLRPRPRSAPGSTPGMRRWRTSRPATCTAPPPPPPPPTARPAVASRPTAAGEAALPPRSTSQTCLAATRARPGGTPTQTGWPRSGGRTRTRGTPRR
mmetsp:Transcript_19497/g.65449  ORF Transcript_19497/g.65449 Transcript_19497/m.65449 type:complete len:240 (-) Transcript_19497:422-1141(-)